MNLLFTPEAWAQYLYWQEQDRDVLARVNALIRDTRRDPFRGLGKPEPLKAEFKGYWSRRITGGHRLVYRVSGKSEVKQLEVVACRFHYGAG